MPKPYGFSRPKPNGSRLPNNTYASALAYVCTQSTGVTVDVDTPPKARIGRLLTMGDFICGSIFS
jgi:hypothetical protein